MLILCLWIPLKGDKSVVIMFSRFVYSLIEAEDQNDTIGLAKSIIWIFP